MKTKLRENFNKMDKEVINMMKKGVRFSLFFCIIALGMLMLYNFNTYFQVHDIYYGSIILFKTGLMLAISSVISGIAVDTIKKQMI